MRTINRNMSLYKIIIEIYCSFYIGIILITHILVVKFCHLRLISLNQRISELFNLTITNDMKSNVKNVMPTNIDTKILTIGKIYHGITEFIDKTNACFGIQVRLIDF